jgi:hypothetical protein
MLNFPPGGEVWWTAINPNPPKGRLHGAIAKSLGARAGCPDLMLVHRGWATFIELKAARGGVSNVQALCHLDIEKAGGLRAVCRSVEAVEEFLVLHGFPVRARVAA